MFTEWNYCLWKTCICEEHNYLYTLKYYLNAINLPQYFFSSVIIHHYTFLYCQSLISLQFPNYLVIKFSWRVSSFMNGLCLQRKLIAVCWKYSVCFGQTTFFAQFLLEVKTVLTRNEIQIVLLFFEEDSNKYWL